MANIFIAPSVLACDFSILKKEMSDIESAGADYIHIDVMDGLFVPNLTFGPTIIKAIKKTTTLPLDVHLMIEKPENSIDQYLACGSDIITFHIEATNHHHRLLQYIKSKNKKTGIALCPSSPIEHVYDIINLCDQILIMSVNPGFGGQEFIQQSLEKVKKLKSYIVEHKLNTKIEIDGGVNNLTCGKIISAGVDILVSGSYIFNAPNTDYQKRIKSLIP